MPADKPRLRFEVEQGMFPTLASAVRTTAAFLFFFIAFGHAAKSEDARHEARVLPAAARATGGDFGEVCRLIKRAAADNGLPEGFFRRIIWQESRFDPAARSHAGAEGIAQFMPETASSRGLLDPFDPVDALRESASYLRELNRTFGNLGLAAAAYNAGPGRLYRWLSGKRQLPQETLRYVQIVTGQPITAWSSGSAKWNDQVMPDDIPCPTFADIATEADPGRARAIPTVSNWAPWGVQLLGNWTQGEVLADYEKLRRGHLSVLGDKDPMIVVAYGPSGMTKRFLVRVAENTREEAQRVCTELRRQNVACFAVQTPTEQEVLAKARRYARLMSYAHMPASSPAQGLCLRHRGRRDASSVAGCL
jgi:hypothetical protein